MHSPPCTRKNLESFVDIRCTESVVAMCWGHSPPRICKSSTANNCALNKANDRKGNPDLLSARNSLSKSLILRELSRETCRTFSNGTTASSNFPYKSLAESQISIHPSLQFHTHTLNSTLRLTTYETQHAQLMWEIKFPLMLKISCIGGYISSPIYNIKFPHQNHHLRNILVAILSKGFNGD